MYQLFVFCLFCLSVFFFVFFVVFDSRETTIRDKFLGDKHRDILRTFSQNVESMLSGCFQSVNLF